ncbi:polyribonucleotide nucleotidyltransferase [Candidatus Gottesmanbacteria bacterium]|nr:polyribonucleotide nucleotidyltransferase [Candidatus Gottesmanbacteria bacterium]
MKKTLGNLTLEINKVAPQANASVLARCGDTEVLATVVSAGAKSNLGFFPLTVDFVERLYAGGVIKGSRWVKREGRPTDGGILTGRLIDRSIRPLFPKDFMDEVQVIVTLLSVDNENDYDTLAIIAASAALHVSNIPWNGPVGAVRVKKDDLDLIVSTVKDGIIMVEAGAKQMPEEDMVKAIAEGQKEANKIIEFLEDIRKETGKDKYPYVGKKPDQELINKIEKDCLKDLEPLVFINDPSSKPKTFLIEELKIALVQKYPENKDQIGEVVDLIIKKQVRKSILEKKKRSDGRKLIEVRPISVEVGLLPRTHGSALFQRGLTQILSVVTLASPDLEQWIETAEGMEEKQYLHHYSDPPYALGETGRLGGLGRREIGHGALAERALFPVIPSQDKFPYTIRVVSEVLSSNGSTSMGSTCGSTLALMDAGVPLTAPVSGVAMGIVADSPEKYEILTDITAFEDFYGNMDFKIAGTEKGVTALQLDVKVGDGFHGLTEEIILRIFEQGREGRLFILKKMLEILPQSRNTVSQYAPKVITVKIPMDKIGEVIGPGGKSIRNIIATTGAAVDVDDNGLVVISATDAEAVEKAKKWIEGMTRELVVGEEFAEAEVKRILPFGAFVEVLPGKEGLVHVSRMTAGFVSNPEEVVHLGQKVKVKVIEIDEMGRLNLAMYWGPKEMSNRSFPNRGFTPQRGGRRDRY